MDTKSSSGFTPLIYCAMYGYRESLGGLLAKGADVHAECIGGKTALDLAVLKGRVNCVLLLLQHDATLKLPEKKPYQALHGLIYLLHKGFVSVGLLRILRLYLL